MQTEYLPFFMEVPNNGCFRPGIRVRLLGFELWWNQATKKWLTLAMVQWEWHGEWRTCHDIVIGMTYADHYHWLHSFKVNPKVRYGKKGRREPVYNRLMYAGTKQSTFEDSRITLDLLRKAGF